MLKHAKFFKYPVVLKIYISMQNKLFPMCSLLHKSSKFLTPIKMHTLITNM